MVFYDFEVFTQDWLVPHGFTAECVDGPYKGRKIDRCPLAETYFGDSEEPEKVFADKDFYKSHWVIIPTPIEFHQVKELLEDSFIVRLDTKDRDPRLLWKYEGNICTKNVG